MKACLGIAILFAVGLMSQPLYAKEGKKPDASCAGGKMACVNRCIAAGGRQRYCPEWCEKNRGC